MPQRTPGGAPTANAHRTRWELLARAVPAPLAPRGSAAGALVLPRSLRCDDRRGSRRVAGLVALALLLEHECGADLLAHAMVTLVMVPAVIATGAPRGSHARCRFPRPPRMLLAVSQETPANCTDTTA